MYDGFQKKILDPYSLDQMANYFKCIFNQWNNVILLEYEEKTLKETVEKYIKNERMKKNKLMVKLSVKKFTKYQNW